MGQNPSGFAQRRYSGCVPLHGLIAFSTSTVLPVNNAGFVYGLDKVGDLADADIDAMFGTNVFGLISMTQLLLRRKNVMLLSDTYSLTADVDFKERNSGHIINLGSIAGIEAYSGGSIYCATKHA